MLFKRWIMILYYTYEYQQVQGGGSRLVVSTAAFTARVRGSFPGLGGLKEPKMCLPHLRVKVSIVGSLRVQEVACSASDRQGSNFESCVWRTVSSNSSHHPQEVPLCIYVHKGGLKPDLFYFYQRVLHSKLVKSNFFAWQVSRCVCKVQTKQYIYIIRKKPS